MNANARGQAAGVGRGVAGYRRAVRALDALASTGRLTVEAGRDEWQAALTRYHEALTSYDRGHHKPFANP